jgi:hypothetical protein
MLKYFYLAVFTLVLAVMSTSGAVAGPQDRSVRPGADKLAADWDDRICCRRGSNDFWATRRNCNRWGGYKVRDRSCREDWNDRWDNRWWGWGSDWDRRICCKRGDRDWWTNARDCRNSFGYETDRRECRDDRDNRGGDWNNSWDNRWRNWNGQWDERVCCKRGDHDWWSTNRECRERGGWRVDRDECRDDRDNRGGDWNDSWDNRWRNWNGEWDERVCCKKGDHDWWSTNRECRERGGWRVDRDECRRD